ncbi:hypothetical protein [Sphingobium sp.]|uniref:hypothetical protein n=1 Tax=Sphingobium sp. TaxID=1912891 RepID=UPI002C5E7020|nr:hypothetical protein [Sphingobium sp.]HUD93695.1 hypothetical protein [Sphingobium sp.]
MTIYRAQRNYEGSLDRSISQDAVGILIEHPDAVVTLKDVEVRNAPTGLGGFLNNAQLNDLHFNNVDCAIDAPTAINANIQGIRINGKAPKP